MNTEKGITPPFGLKTIFIVFSLLIVLSAYFYYSTYKTSIINNVREELSVVCIMTVNEIGLWQKETLRDAKYISNNQFRANEVKNLLHNPHNEALRSDIEAWLDDIKTSYEYKEVAIFDRHGQVVLSTGKDIHQNTMHSEFSRSALKKKDVVLGELHRYEETGDMHIGVFTPLTSSKDEGHEAVAGMMILIDPHNLLYPLIEASPIRAKTAETVLIRRDGNDVLYLSNIRSKKDAALSLRIPLAKKEDAAVQAITGSGGYIEGYDYRNIPLISVAQKVPGTQWTLVSQIESSEASKPLRRIIPILIALVLSSIGGAALALAYVKKKQIAEFYLKIYESEIAAKDAINKYTLLFNESRDIILFVRKSDGKIVEANESAVKVYGYLHNELLALHIEDLRYDKGSREIAEQMQKADTEGVLFQTYHVCKDGSNFPVEVNSFGTTLGGQRVLISIIRDITERKAVEEQLTNILNEREIILENANVGISKIVDRTLIWSNRKCEELFQYSTEEIAGQTTRVLYSSQEAYEKLGKDAYPVLAEGHPYTTEQMMMRKDGNEIWVMLNGKAIEPPDISKGTIWIFEDITEQKKATEERERLLVELQEALANVKILRGLLPICSSCKKIRSDDGYWTQIETYLRKNSEAEFTHGMCPECAKKLYPDIWDKISDKL